MQLPLVPFPDGPSLTVQGQKGVSSTVLEVIVRSKAGDEKEGKLAGCALRYTVNLPAVCRIGKNCVVKVCRKAGLLVVRAPKIV